MVSSYERTFLIRSIITLLVVSVGCVVSPLMMVGRLLDVELPRSVDNKHSDSGLSRTMSDISILLGLVDDSQSMMVKLPDDGMIVLARLMLVVLTMIVVVGLAIIVTILVQ